MAVNDLPRTIWWEDDKVYLLDETRLPLTGDVLVCATCDGLILAIKSLAVRGAPALGAAGALGVALWCATEGREHDAVDEAYLKRCAEVCEELAQARPTAVNLSWGVKRMQHLIQKQAAAAADLSPQQLAEAVIAAAGALCAEDEAINRRLAANGAALFDKPTNFLTHCNAGSLATVFYGTAVGVIYSAAEQGHVEHVWVDETRPVNQGARLTAWELLQAGVPATLIADDMAGAVMREGWVDAVVVGADRICANGDTANKIGTYSLSVLAKEHQIPFYICAPASTFDLSLADGSQIVVEERDHRELEGVTVSGRFDATTPEMQRALEALCASEDAQLAMAQGHVMEIRRKGGGFAFDAWFRTTPTHVQSFNPAFDVTPAANITAFITERSVIYPGKDGYDLTALGAL
ncbi:MAG: S-methyl-5-thioribose-1-phosphate isomerase [Actinomycetia bacterium]|nr:S-methyl-5-thioribose-1-phosphate isomerase [Actinomycetes bacterium]